MCHGSKPIVSSRRKFHQVTEKMSHGSKTTVIYIYFWVLHPVACIIKEKLLRETALLITLILLSSRMKFHQATEDVSWK
jgi:hypothetical protein